MDYLILQLYKNWKKGNQKSVKEILASKTLLDKILLTVAAVLGVLTLIFSVICIIIQNDICNIVMIALLFIYVVIVIIFAFREERSRINHTNSFIKDGIKNYASLKSILADAGYNTQTKINNLKTRVDDKLENQKSNHSKKQTSLDNLVKVLLIPLLLLVFEKIITNTLDLMIILSFIALCIIIMILYYALLVSSLYIDKIFISEIDNWESLSESLAYILEFYDELEE